jgi:V/A-type H+-transporting ATPase subunit B
MIRLYADALKAKERDRMGFKLSSWDNKLLKYQQQFRSKFMSLDVNIPLEEALDLGWRMLSDCFEKEEVGIKKEVVDIHWVLL